MNAGQHVVEVLGLFLIIFGGASWGGKHSASTSPPGTRRERYDTRLKRVPVWAFVTMIVVGVGLLAVAAI